ncbi:MAG: hypothetical protein Q9227_006523 [Pyrenula ochraceoflavens]
MAKKMMAGNKPALARHSRSRPRAASRGRSRTRRSSPSGNRFFSPAWVDVQSSYYSGAEGDSEDLEYDTDDEEELVARQPPLQSQPGARPHTGEEGMIFDIIDQINDIQLRNLEGQQRSSMEVPTIGEDSEDATEKDLEKHIGDDSSITYSSEDMDTQPPLELNKIPSKPRDPDLVTFDGPDDPENPKNWPNRKRWLATLSVASFTFLAPLTSSMVAPAVPEIQEEFGIHGDVLPEIVLSIFVLAFAVGPLVLGPLSEVYGRVKVLQVSNLLFLIFNLAAGFSRNTAQMIAFRFLSGLGGSGPLAIGAGVLGDLFRPEERGKAMAMYGLGPLLGPSLGPIAGSWIAYTTTWRWMFRATSIACGIIFVFGLFNLKESYAPFILSQKAKRLRAQTGNTKLHTESETSDRNSAKFILSSIGRSFRLLFTQPIVQVLAVYMAYSYGLMYLVLATFPRLWMEKYNESLGISGLNYISLGLGFFFGAPLCGKTNDVIYHRMKARSPTKEGKPEYRMPLMIPFSLLVPCGLFLYGWTAETKTHWIVPNIGAAIFAAGTIAAFQCVQTYIVDAYTRYAASAIGAVTVLRSLAGFGFPLFAPIMYKKLNYGWGNSVLGFAAIGIGFPAPVLLWLYGERLRKHSPFAAG